MSNSGSLPHQDYSGTLGYNPRQDWVKIWSRISKMLSMSLVNGGVKKFYAFELNRRQTSLDLV